MIFTKKKIPIGFYGYGTRALDALMEHPDFDVRYNWAPASRICDEVSQAAKRYEKKVHFEAIRNRSDLLEHVKQARDVDCFLMNASPIILNEPILEQMDFYNIHPGNLTNNRGHHPHLWSILLDEKETQINLHSVTPEIDLGKVIASVTVPVFEDDTSLTLLDRTEDHIGELLTALAAYLRGEQKEASFIEKGEYRRKVTFEDYRINPETDTRRDMDRKIRARAMHSGGFFDLEGKRCYVDRILDWKDGERKENAAATVEECQGILVFCRGDEIIRFQESKITDQEGNVVWRRPGKEEDQQQTGLTG